MHGYLEEHRIRAAELDAQIQDLERALSALRTRRALVQEQLELFKYPVLTLPNEIVAEIFVGFLPGYPEYSFVRGLFSPVTLTHICRKWRGIALSTPALWRSISLYLGPDDPATQEVRELEIWLSRSGCGPMSAEIMVLPGSPLRPGYKFSSAHCACWEDLKIDLPSYRLPITEAAMPWLRHLDLTVDDYTASPNLILCREMPLLRSVVMNDYAAHSVTLPWVQLTSLELHRVYPSECTPILQQTPNLVHCKLSLAEGNEIPDDTTLPSLKSLVLVGRNSGDTVIGYLETFIVPALHELDIPEHFLEDPVDSLAYFVSKSGCHPRKVTISGHRYFSSDTYCAAFPSVEFSFAGKYKGTGPDVAPLE